jgi:hypothetical protein
VYRGGGKLHIVNRIPDLSTSQIVARLAAGAQL